MALNKLRKKSACNYYIQYQFKKVKDTGNEKATTVLMSEFSKKWQKLPESEKVPYQEMADKFNAESFTDAGRIRKKLNRYNVFMKEKLIEYQTSGGDMSPKDRLKKIAGEWKKLDDAEKDEYREKAKEMSGGVSDTEPENDSSVFKSNLNNNDDKCKNLSESDLCCVICMEEKKNHVFIPCGHVVCCGKCTKVSNCPICREPITHVQKIYY